MKSHTEDVINGIYAVMAEPMQYDDFMIEWDDFISATLSGSQAGQGSKPLDAALLPHFRTALEILERLGRQRTLNVSDQSVVEEAPGMALLLSADGKIVASNRKVARLVQSARDVAGLHIDAISATKIRSWIAAPVGTTLFSTCQLGEQLTPACFMLKLLQGSAGVGSHVGPIHLLSLVDLYLDDIVTDALPGVFGFSRAEAEVASMLGNGMTPAAIAQARTASIHTVRSQIRSILGKSGARAIPDLVRILCGFAAVVDRSADRPTLTLSPKRRRTARLQLADGRMLEYTEQGAVSGTPVLFFHGMLLGVNWTDQSLEVCARKGLRVIAPSRAGYGATGSLTDDIRGDELVDRVVDDVRQLVCELRLFPAIVVGHAAGSVYAQRFAARFPEHAAALMFISHAPYWDDSLFDILPPRQRVVAQTARLAPSVLSFVARAGVALIDVGREDRFLQALHQEVSVDIRALRRPEIYDVLLDGLHHAVQQGGDAFCRDCEIIIRDWSPDAEDVKCPILLIHGLDDRVVTRRWIDGYAARVARSEPFFLPEAGQFLLYSHWPRVVEQISRLQALSSRQ